ncbi:MAG: riboflavin synthase [Zetaproteobacteria bacterium]|nr:riboflavin synthase [Zetaproteobacteria bacterium]
MFTGIIQDVGTIVAIHREMEQTHMRFATHLRTDLPGSAWQLGDSIAVDGCCLTVTELDRNASIHQFTATLSLETLRRTCFNNARVGKKINIEPALCMGDRLGGHLVTGHIDATMRLVVMHTVGEHLQMQWSVPRPFRPYVIQKGSIAINGVSLTLNEVDDKTVTVNLIPHTLAHTNLGTLTVGDEANLETDMMGRYVERILSYQERP